MIDFLSFKKTMEGPLADRTPSSYSKSCKDGTTYFSVTVGRHPLAGVSMADMLVPGVALFKKLSQPKTAGLEGSKLVFGAMQPFYKNVIITVVPGALAFPYEFRQHFSGKTGIPRSELHCLTIRNYLAEGSQTVHNIKNPGAAWGLQKRIELINEVGWAVDAESGGRAYTLAFGMNEVCARGLMTDIEKVLSS